MNNITNEQILIFDFINQFEVLRGWITFFEYSDSQSVAKAQECYDAAPVNLTISKQPVIKVENNVK